MRKIILLLIAYSIATSGLLAQINALFSVDATEGCEPLIVQFADASTSNGTIVTWDWDFDDSSVSNVQNPMHTFAVPGTDYNVCLTVTDDLAQSDTYCMTVSVLDSLVLDALMIEPLCFGSSDGSIDLTVSGGLPPYNYAWSNSENTQDLDNIVAGTYSVTVTDDSNCLMVETYVLNEPPELLMTGTTTDASCFGENDGSITLFITGGTPPYEYLWSTNDISQNLTNLGPGAYTVTVTDANDCEVNDVFIVTEPAQLALTLAITDELLCAGECDGVISAEVSGGCQPYLYEWSNGNNTPQVEGLCDSGLYSLTITDCNGCTSTVEIELQEAPDPMEITYETTCATSADDGSIDITVSGGVPPYDYLWSNGATTEEVDNLAPGAYTVYITDANDCTYSETIPLSNIILDMPNDTTVCDGDQLQLFVDAPTAVSFEWTPSDNLSCSDCPDPIYTADIFGPMTYLVTVEDTNGCIEEDFFVITVQSYLDFGLLEFSNSPVFEGDTLELYCNVWNTNSVEWTGPGNFTSTECNPLVANADAGLEGTFSLILEDEYGCEASATTEVDILTIIDSIGEWGTICLGETYQLFVDAPDATSITWSPAATLDNPNIADPIASPTESTTYFVTVEDANGDIDVTKIFVEVETAPTIDPSGPLTICYGEIVLICAGPWAGTYTWTGPNSFISNGPCFEFDMGLSPGCYELEYTSPNGCVFYDEICISVIDFYIQSLTSPFVICPGESGVLEVDAPGAVSYQWWPDTLVDCPTCPSVVTSPEMTQDYLITVFDANGCQDNLVTTIDVDQDCVWPGDTDTSKVVDNFDLLNIGLAYDSIGPMRSNATILWDGQPAPDWLLNQPGIDVDFKHIDCNGDGVINADDTTAIIQNWGEMHNIADQDDEVNFTAEPPFYVDPDTLIEGESISLSVILGEMDDPANDVYGIAFSLEYDSSVVVPGSAKMTFADSWIGSKGTDMITIQKTFVSPGVVNIGMTRIDGEEMDGYGEIGQLFITIEDDILLRDGDDDSRNGNGLEVAFNISNVRIINRLGEEIPVDPLETSTVVDGTVGTNTIPWDENIQVHPNPAKEAFFITSKNIKIENVALFAVTGELLLFQKSDGAETQINMQKFQPGIYHLKVQTEMGVMVERIVIAK